MGRELGHIVPDLTQTPREREEQRQLLRNYRSAITSLRATEAELREQASGSQDGYLLGVADRIRAALQHL